MENDLQAYRTDSLFAELGNWNRQENKFREIFSDDALKDREFQRMKLENYDLLYLKYAGKPLTQDEQAMLAMLQFQRRKMEKALYPGLLSRLIHRANNLIKGMWMRQRENAIADRENLQQFAYNTPNLGACGNEQPQKKNGKQDATLRQMSRQYPMTRKQSRMKQHHKKGHGI
jgi:hypothetical protein